MKYTRLALALWSFVLLAVPLTGMGQFSYVTNGGTITITHCSCSGGTVDIPSAVGGLPVTTISPSAFSDCPEPVGVTIPNSVTNIGDLAFYYCFGLTNITVDPMNSAYTSVAGVLFDKSLTTLLFYPRGRSGNENYAVPNGVVDIGDYAFSGSAGLGAVTIPDSVVRIGNEAFSDCTGLRSLILPESVSSLGTDAFAYCSGLTNVSLPNSLVRIGYGAFSQCTSLYSIVIPDSVTELEGRALSECGSLTSVTIGSGVKIIPFGAFFGCASLTNVTIPHGITNIDDIAFLDCVSIASATVPDTVVRIGADAFSQCYSLTSVTIGSGLVDLQRRVFLFSNNLTNIQVSAVNPVLASREGILFNKDFTKVLQCPEGKSGNYRIPESVTVIGEEAFYYCTVLTNVTIPSGIHYIGKRAFAYCVNVKGFLFEGAPPVYDRYAFDSDDLSIVYYLPDAAEVWGTYYANRPTQLWNPTIQTTGSDYGVSSNGFGFTIKGTADIPFVVVACTNLNNSTWFPLQSFTLTNGQIFFSDSNWVDFPSRFYRISAP